MKKKQLLLKDLCARLPYGVQIYHIYSEKSVEFNSKHLNQIGAFKILPYLRSLSSMTEDERKEMVKLHIDDRLSGKIEICDANCIDFYNSHHLDYRGLIPMGLALEAPEGMYNISNKTIETHD